MTNVRDNGESWIRGWQSFGQQKYWIAHEYWEQVWLGFPSHCHGRHLCQALIQVSASFYKPEQAVEGRSDAMMQRGMTRLIDFAQERIELARRSPPPTLEVDPQLLLQLLREASDACHRWKQGHSLDELRAQLAQVSRHAAEEMLNGPIDDP